MIPNKNDGKTLTKNIYQTMKKSFALLTTIAASIALIACSPDTTVTSPDGRIRTSVALNEE